MRKVIAAFNVTLDGYCDHTAVTPGADIHNHYSDLLHQSGVLLYGRTTFELMKFWQHLLEHPSDETSMNDFAASIHSVPKVVFSSKLKSTGWNSAELADSSLQSTIELLKKTPGKPIVAGSRSIILQLLQLSLLDELQLVVHPVIAGKGLPLFTPLETPRNLHLVHSKTFESGAIALTYHLL